MEKGLESVVEWIKTIFSDGYSLLVGTLSGLLSFYSPIKDPINLLVILFAVDALIGYLKNRKLNNEKFSKRKIFETTIPRMIAVVTFICLLYALDVTFRQEYVATYLTVGYFVGGVLLFNIGKNLYHLTKWKAFLQIQNMLSKNVEEKTGEPLKHSKHEDK